MPEAEGVAEFVRHDLGERSARDTGGRRNVVLDDQVAFHDVVSVIGPGLMGRIRGEGRGPIPAARHAVETALTDHPAGARVPGAGDLLLWIVEEDLIHSVRIGEAAGVLLDAGVLVF